MTLKDLIELLECASEEEKEFEVCGLDGHEQYTISDVQFDHESKKVIFE